jgi:uridine kinase
MDLPFMEFTLADNLDIIIPRGIENKTAISLFFLSKGTVTELTRHTDMVVRHIQDKLQTKSQKHQSDLKKLGSLAKSSPLGQNVFVMPQTPQLMGMSTILQDPETDGVDFVFYFDRVAALLIEKALDLAEYEQSTVTTPLSLPYHGLKPSGPISGIFVLRGGACLEPALQRTLPAALTGRLLIQSVASTSEPALHYLSLPQSVSEHSTVLLLDSQMSSGGAALMAVKVLVDHGVDEERIVFVTWMAGEFGVKRLISVFKKVKVVVGIMGQGNEMEGDERWVEKRYFGC